MTLESIPVPLGERSYPILLGHDSADAFGEACRTHGVPDRIALITDNHVAPLHLKPLLRSLKSAGFRVTPIIIPPGEKQKSIRQAEALYGKLLEAGIGRSGGLMAVGGGVIGDLGGFVAATWLRGIPLVQVPTTLLAQVDSSVGGKTGVNHPRGKNLIGAFHQPRFVWADAAYLRTLPKREIVSGIGEIVKYAILGGPAFFAELEADLERLICLEEKTLLRFLRACIASKADLVARDERETSGVRMALNLGHTVGHALEAAGGFRLWTHGETVLLGLVAESRIAHALGMMTEDHAERVRSLVARLGVRLPLNRVKMADILRAMGHDKKNDGHGVRFVLPVTFGETRIIDAVPTEIVRDAIRGLPKLLRKDGSRAM